MNSYKLIINPFAEQDILEARDWYNHQQEGLGNELIQEIKDTVKSIENNPLLYAAVKKDIRKAVTRRFPYSLFFTIIETKIIVFAVFHQSRNPRIWKTRKK